MARLSFALGYLNTKMILILLKMFSTKSGQQVFELHISLYYERIWGCRQLQWVMITFNARDYKGAACRNLRCVLKRNI